MTLNLFSARRLRSQRSPRHYQRPKTVDRRASIPRICKFYITKHFIVGVLHEILSIKNPRMRFNPLSVYRSFVIDAIMATTYTGKDRFIVKAINNGATQKHLCAQVRFLYTIHVNKVLLTFSRKVK